MSRRQFALGDLFTEAELQRITAIVREHDPNKQGSLARRLMTEIVVPAMPRIDEVTKQKNDPMYIAYAIEYATMCATGTHQPRSK